jgi:hypothetical protein
MNCIHPVGEVSVNSRKKVQFQRLQEDQNLRVVKLQPLPQMLDFWPNDEIPFNIVRKALSFTKFGILFEEFLAV